MNGRAKSAVAGFALALGLGLGATTPEQVFQDPPKAAHAGVWWHWMGGQVTEEGIVKDLDWFQRTGIFSATVFGMADSCTPWAKRIGGVPTGGLRPFDERWWKLFAFACREGRKRGIDIGLHNCPGYTSTGGRWIPSRLAMRELVFNVTNAAEQVSTRPNAIFPVYNEETRRYELPPCPARQTDVVEIGVARGGIRVAHIPMGAFVQPADWDSFGLECDKMNPEAVDFHLDHVFGELKKHLGDDLPAAGLRHILLDSYEAGTPTWTPRMREDFKSRRGYDPLEFLPILGGHTNLYAAAEVAKFKEDFDRTVKDLYRDVLFKRMSERIHAEGLEFSNEPYEGPFLSAEVAPFIDRIMTEFWYSTKGSRINPAHRAFNTYAGPGGRRHNVVEAEAFTGQPGNCEWTEMPENLKPAADDAFLGGVNRMILHTNPLQPWGDDVKPGVTMGRWGTHFGRNQTWAECGKAWFDYLARCQALLQWGEPSARTLALPKGVRQLARTDGRRTLFFVVADENGTVRLGLPRGKWFDPVTGRIGGVPSRLAARQSGFYEQDASAPEVADAPRMRCALDRFEPALGDRSKSADPAVRYFSGTLAYRTVFDRPRAAERLTLQVKTFEQVVTVRLNGVAVGTVWCAPWEVELPAEALKASGNVLELDVTNSWRNRLVGDEQEPADCTFAEAPMAGGAFLERYPDWFEDGLAARPSKGRRCFTTWNYFTKDSPLTPSGLVEPPVLLWAAEPELEIRRLDPAAKYEKPELKVAAEAQYAALKSYLDAEGVGYREIGATDTPRARFVLNVNEKEVQEMHGIGAYGKPVDAFLKDIRRRLADARPVPVLSAQDADELQRLADAAVGAESRTLVLEGGRTYRLTRPLRLDARHSGLTVDGNGAVVEAGRAVTGWRAEGNLLVADVPDWDGEILSLWVNGRRAQLAQAPNGERARMKTKPPKPSARPYPFDTVMDGVSVDVRDLAGVLASTEEERADAFVDYTIAWFTPKCRLVQAYDNGDGTANLLARNVACLHGTGKTSVRYVPFNFGPYQKAWSGEAGAVVSNLRRLLDAPGEFFFDRKAGRLLYMPREGETAANVTAHFATLERALEIVGDSPAARVRDVTVRNVAFRYGRQDRNSPDGFAPASQAAAKCGGFLHVANAENVRFEDIRVEHCDVYGVAFAGGVWDSSLVGSKLVDCGSGGVRVGVDYTVIPDGDDRNDPRQCGYVSIVGNEIRAYGRWNRSGCGVTLFDVGNCRVEGNDISDGFYTGISVGWTWNSPKAHTQNNRIVRNHIRNLGQGVVDDLAGIYVLGGESYGSVVAENDIRDVSRFNYGGWGIYLDSRAGHYLVESNRCENCDDGGFFKNQGVRNVVRGNAFLYGRYTQLGDEPADDDDILFEDNVIVYRAPAVVFRSHIPRISRGIWRNNTYWCENGPVTFGPQGYSLEDLQRFGLERGSVVADPRKAGRIAPRRD